MANSTNIPKFIEELNLTNSTNDKIATLTKYKDDALVQRVLKMTYDKVVFTFGVTMRNVKAGSSENTQSLSWGLDQLDRLVSREYTGNAAIALVETVLEAMNEEDREVIIKILGRDLKINMGRTNINKVIKNLITKPIYMRCDIGTKETIQKNISFPAIIDLKADGTYRECSTNDFGTNASFISRSGESYSYPLLEKLMKDIKPGYMHGEMTIICNDDILQLILPKVRKSDIKNGTNDAEKLEKTYLEHKAEGREYILPRNLGNGLLNSDDVPFENIVFEVWDFVSPEDYTLAGNLKALKKETSKRLKSKEITKEEQKRIISEGTPKETYRERFQNLKDIISEIQSKNIRVIEHKEVQNLKEAYEFTSEKMKEGLEGAILKDYNMVYEDGTSKQSLKLKIQFEIDARITGFIEGTPGTKRELTFGSMTYETDDGLIKGSVSGFNDTELNDFNSRRDELIGKIIEIQANDLTKSRGSNTFALSHPRFVALRDKDTTDTLERAKKSIEMAKDLN